MSVTGLLVDAAQVAAIVVFVRRFRARKRGRADATSEQRFYCAETFIVPTAFVVVGATVAWYAIPDPGGRPVGIGAAVVAVVVFAFGVSSPYRAVVRADRLITFSALARSTTTNIADITRITVGGGRGARYDFHIKDGTSGYSGFSGHPFMFGLGGRALARFIVEHNPTITDRPGRLGGP